MGQPKKTIDPQLELMVRRGLMTRERAEEVDDLAGELATDVQEETLSLGEAFTVAAVLGKRDGEIELARRRGRSAKRGS